MFTRKLTIKALRQGDTPVTKRGGMALKQGYSVEEDRNMCQFNSFLHAFIMNEELNYVACKNLQTRIDHGEPMWKELLRILCNEDYKKNVQQIT